MPISPYYKRLWTEEDRNAPVAPELRYGVGMTPPARPNLGVEIPPMPDTMMDIGAFLPSNPQRSDSPQQNEKRTNPLGSQEAPASPQPPALEIPPMPETVDENRQRERLLLGALSEATAGVGNLGGQASATNVPKFAMDVNTLESQNFANNLARQKQTYDIRKAQADQAMVGRKRDPMSPESQQARQFFNTYFAKYLGGSTIPDNVSAEQIEKFAGPLSNLAYNQQKAAFDMNAMNVKGEQAIAQIEKQGEIRRENYSTEAEFEAAKDARRAQLQKELAEMNNAADIRIANIGANARLATAGAKGSGNGKGITANKGIDIQNKYMGDKGIAAYKQLDANYRLLASNINKASGVNDLMTVYNFIKALDPGSVVKEGEIAMLSRAVALKDRLTNIFDKLSTGATLTPNTRQEILTAMKSLRDIGAQNVESINNVMRESGKRYGFDPEYFLVKTGVSGGGSAPSSGGVKGKAWTPPAKK